MKRPQYFNSDCQFLEENEYSELLGSFSVSNQNKALLRQEDTILTTSASRLMLHTPQGNTAGIVKCLTLNILTNNQVHMQVKRK